MAKILLILDINSLCILDYDSATDSTKINMSYLIRHILQESQDSKDVELVICVIGTLSSKIPNAYRKQLAGISDLDVPFSDLNKLFQNRPFSMLTYTMNGMQIDAIPGLDQFADIPPQDRMLVSNTASLIAYFKHAGCQITEATRLGEIHIYNSNDHLSNNENGPFSFHILLDLDESAFFNADSCVLQTTVVNKFVINQIKKIQNQHPDVTIQPITARFWDEREEKAEQVWSFQSIRLAYAQHGIILQKPVYTRSFVNGQLITLCSKFEWIKQNYPSDFQKLYFIEDNWGELDPAWSAINQSNSSWIKRLQLFYICSDGYVTPNSYESLFAFITQPRQPTSHTSTAVNSESLFGGSSQLKRKLTSSGSDPDSGSLKRRKNDEEDVEQLSDSKTEESSGSLVSAQIDITDGLIPASEFASSSSLTS